MNAPNVTTVDVASAWASKINWTQVIGTGVNVATWGLGLLPPQYQAIGAIGIQALTSAATWYFRTYQTTTITPSSFANK